MRTVGFPKQFVGVALVSGLVVPPSYAETRALSGVLSVPPYNKPR